MATVLHKIFAKITKTCENCLKKVHKYGIIFIV